MGALDTVNRKVTTEVVGLQESDSETGTPAQITEKLRSQREEGIG